MHGTGSFNMHGTGSWVYQKVGAKIYHESRIVFAVKLSKVMIVKKPLKFNNKDFGLIESQVLNL
jgi:hypothetical protein